MKLLDSDRSRRALTLIDVLIVIAVIAIVATLVLPPDHHRVRAKRISCINNLKQVGLGFRMWSNEHSDQFPWNVPQTNGGTMELAMSADVSRHFEIASKEMNFPKNSVLPVRHAAEQDERVATPDFQWKYQLLHWFRCRRNEATEHFIG